MDMEPVTRMTKDIVEASRVLSHGEARFLVDTYYAMQENRMRDNAQVRELVETKEPHDVLRWLAVQHQSLENQLKRALARYAESSPLGEWALSVVGIGPVITAGLLAHIDIKKAPTVGHIWRFAGLDPTQKWEKKTKRPWNARLKTLCWKIGESFVKVSAHEDAFYGQLYVQRKAQEIERNERGDFREQAATTLQEKKFKADTEAKKHYEAGRLPPAHIHARAKRYAVKLFLAHYHEVAYRLEYRTDPPVPYPIAILGHAHKIEVPQP